ncbi:MAG TPA: hypothetical protein VMA71_07350 [Alloacidobacterium sp.]|nr:hypothetical protein [Alloacidobacterium sp.]
MSDPNEKPGGVFAAAIVLALMGAFGLLSTAFSAVTLFFTSHAIAPAIPSVRILLAVAHLLMLAAVLWSFWTVVGLFRYRTWARYSIIVLGILDFLVFALLSAGLAWLRRNPFIASMDAHPNPSMPFSPGALMLGLSIFYALLALVGLWWVVYFNLTRVRLAFAALHPGLTR